MVKRSLPRVRTSTSSAQSLPRDPVELLHQLLVIPGPSCGRERWRNTSAVHYKMQGDSAANMVEDDVQRRSPHGGEVGNLIVALDGPRKGPRRLLMAHLDTVPICVGSKPVVRNGVIQSGTRRAGSVPIIGVGSPSFCTRRAGSLRERPDHPPITFLWTVQEEIGLCGARFLKKSLLKRPRLGFNWDGGGATAITIGATGGYRMTIDVRGLASHAGNAPERGVSAIAIAAEAIAQLQRDGWHGRIERNGKLGTSNVGVISGGDATNVVTDHVQLRVEARSHDAGFRQQIVRQLERAFRQAVQKVRNVNGQRGRVEFHGSLDYESYRLAEDEPSVVAAERAIRALGREPELRVTNGGLDANWMAVHGIPTVSMGCGQRNQHMTSEAVVIDEFLLACDIAWQLATDAGGR